MGSEMCIRDRPTDERTASGFTGLEDSFVWEYSGDLIGGLRGYCATVRYRLAGLELCQGTIQFAEYYLVSFEKSG